MLAERYSERMRRPIAPAALVVVLALAGCSATAEPQPAETSTTVATVTVSNIEDAETAEQATDWVLVQEPNSMTGDEVADAATKLNELAAEEHPGDDYASIKLDLNKLTLDAIGMQDAEFQVRLTDLAEQIRDLP